MNFSTQDKFKLFQDTLNKMKLVATTAMMFIHCLLFYSFYNKVDHLPALSFKVKMILTWSLVSLSIPAMAGAELRVRIRSYLQKGKLVDFPEIDFFKILLILALLDTVKSVISSGFDFGLRWDALPLIAIGALLILVYIKRFTVSSLYIIFPFCFILEPRVKQLLEPFAILTNRAASSFRYSSTYLIWMYACIAILGLLIWKIFDNFILIKNKFNRLLKIFLILFFYYTLISHFESNPIFAAAVWNLPFGGMVELGEIGGHIWSIFPWGGVVLGGFLYQHLFEQVCNKDRQSYWPFGIVTSSACLIMIIFLWRYFPLYYALLSPIHYFSSGVFQGRVWLSLVVLSFYICLHFITFFLSQLWPTSDNLIVRFFGSGMLINYIVHFILAAKLAPVAARLFNGKLGVINYYIFISLNTFAISFLLIYLYQSRLTFSYTKIAKK